MNLLKEYVTKFQSDLGSFLYSAASEEESIRHMEQLKVENILFLMEHKKAPASKLDEVPRPSKQVPATEPSTSEAELNNEPPEAPRVDQVNEPYVEIEQQTPEESYKVKKGTEGLKDIPVKPDEDLKVNKRIASSDASLPKGNRRSRGLWEEPESGTVLGTTLRSMQQPMRRISWAASLCLPLPVDNNTEQVKEDKEHKSNTGNTKSEIKDKDENVDPEKKDVPVLPDENQEEPVRKKG